MAKFFCSYSGLEITTSYFPITLQSRESHHPIFDTPLKKLWKYVPKWSAGELSTVDSYLLFLALLNSTELVKWYCPAKITEHTNSIVASQMLPLVSAIHKIAGIKHPVFAVPRFALTEATADLSSISALIFSWHEAHDEFLQGCSREKYKSKLQAKEIALERLIKNPSMNPTRYAHILASWAALAGSFPEYHVTDTAGQVTSLSEYWQNIIIRCHTDTEVISIPCADLEELLEFCETNIEVGTIFSNHLLTTIRCGLSTVKTFLETPFQLINSEDQSSVEAANMANLLASAPTEEPKRINYPTEFAWIKAKMKWQLAQKYKGASPDSPASL